MKGYMYKYQNKTGDYVKEICTNIETEGETKSKDICTNIETEGETMSKDICTNIETERET